MEFPRSADGTYDKEFHFHSERRLPKRSAKPAANTAPANSSEKSSQCPVALIGFGTVGRAVAKILGENLGGSLRLTHICNRNVESKKQSWVPSNVVWTDDVECVLKSDAQIVIELILPA